MFFLAEASDEQALRLWTRNRVSLARPLPLSYAQKIAQVPGVDEVTIFQWFGGTYKDTRDPNNFFPRFAAEPEKLGIVYPEYRLPPDEREAFIQQRTACVVGRKLADRMGFKIGDRIQLEGDIFPVNLELTVRGIYDSPRDNENLIFQNEYLRESMKGLGWGDWTSTFAIKVERVEDVARIATDIDALFRNSTAQTKTETERQFEVSFLAFLGNVKLFLLSICGAITFTILLVSGNTMAMSVRERVREVGIMKTLGFTRGKILAIIVGESVVIAAIGGALGLALAFGICEMMRQAPSTFADMSRVALPAPISALAMTIAILIGIVSSVVPAWNASNLSIVEALRVSD
jgi:putative ABC transport system permease protein